MAELYGLSADGLRFRAFPEEAAAEFGASSLETSLEPASIGHD